MGVQPPQPPSAAVSRMAALRAAWDDAGIEAVETREIRVQRSFPDFAAFWDITATGSGIADAIKLLSQDDAARLKARVETKMPIAPDGSLRYESWANAVKGVRPRAA